MQHVRSDRQSHDENDVSDEVDSERHVGAPRTTAEQSHRQTVNGPAGEPEKHAKPDFAAAASSSNH